MNWLSLLFIATAGSIIGNRFGVDLGIATSLSLYALMPYELR
jgi:hypothetical protein